MEGNLLFPNESYAIVGAAMEVHAKLGSGFTEPVYQEALEIEMKLQKIPYEREKELRINYKGIMLHKTFRPDFCCYNNIIIEIKAVNAILPEHKAQIYNYLKASGKELGILINFGEKSLHYERIPCEQKWN